MVKSVEGIYRNGKVEVVEPIAEAEGSRVIVTWVQTAEPVDPSSSEGSRSLKRPICAADRLRLPRIAIAPETCCVRSNYRRGHVVLVLFPDSNLRTSKRRPAVVVQADGSGPDLPQRIVAMITSNMARAGHPSRVIVRIDSESARGCGLLMDAVIMTDNLATILDS